ncbi:MAG: DNA repair protein RecN [Flavobacteriales bacterium CG_4_9_14_3_um_filter_40_17]|nr:MAG: DNA repair protein RecN [Flavobacteriales bacterium CG_4_9_14_3_um_filter_40_17]
MLTAFSIKNFALVEDLHVNFGRGLSIITGETGAGKSILLDALGLLLGNRADLGSLKNKKEKCVVEGEFAIHNYNLQTLFSQFEFDYEDLTLVRREILPSGKSRAFVNDTPVSLQNLTELGERLIDIHSQHQTMQIADTTFQFQLVDALSNNQDTLAEFRSVLKNLNQAKTEHQGLLAEHQEAVKQAEYNRYLLDELLKADIKPGNQQAWEEQNRQLSNVENIQQQLSESITHLDHEEIGVLHQLAQIKNALGKINSFSIAYKNAFERIESAHIELADISNNLFSLVEKIESNPGQLQLIDEKLQTLYQLQKKHQAATEEELIAVREALQEKVLKTENLSALIKNKKREVENLTNQATLLAGLLHENRTQIIENLEQQLQEIVLQLGMPYARFQINLSSKDDFDKFGKDQIEILFSANKGIPFGSLKKIASGGELSRVMLAVKSVLAKHICLPTIIFDEIDTGISGEVAKQMASVLDKLSQSLQVIAITHLPQIAAKGQHHFKVYKETLSNTTRTQLDLLTDANRVKELAEMLGGKSLSDSAMAHAKELLAGER